jgi:hypothetical protein
MKWFWKYVLILCIVNTQGMAQRPGSIPSNVPTQSYNSDSPNNEAEEDSLEYSYKTLSGLFKERVFDDTFLHEEVIPFYHFHQSRKTLVNTGNLGSAAHNLLFDAPIYTGWHAGYEQYRYYNYNNNSYQIFTGNKPVADLYFSQLSNQSNIMPGAVFYRPFSDGISFNINYRRISQRGYYSGQNTRTTNLGMTLGYNPDQNRYSLQLSYLRNINEEGNNGGIPADQDINAENLKTVIPTLLNNASTRHQHERIILDQFYRLFDKGVNHLSVKLHNQSSYNPQYYKYSDKDLNTGNDTLMYKDLFFDFRGIRRYVKVNHFSNTTELVALTRSNQEIRAGITYDYFMADNTADREVRHDLTLHFDGQIALSKQIIIDTEVKAGVGENIGNFDIRGDLQLKLSRYANLKGYGRFFRTEQSYASRKLVLNFQTILDESRKKSLGSDIGATLEIPAIQLRTSIKQQLWGNPVFWNQESQPQQLDGILSVSLFSAHHKLRLFSFVLENDGWLQLFSDNIYHLPKWITYHRFYWDTKLFRNVMQLNVGTNARLLPAYQGMGYSPVWGQFIASDETLAYVPAIEFFLMAKVSSFRAVFVYENAGLLFRETPNFDIARYPQFQPTLRFGFRWMLFN